MADYTITLSNNPIPFNPSEAHRLQFKFIIKDSQYATTEEHTLIDFGDFELGNDDDDETVYFPGNIKVEFQLDTTLEKFENILLELKSKKTIAQIYRNTDKIFSGYVYEKDVSGYQYTRRIELTIIDQYKRLEITDSLSRPRRSLKPSANPFSYDIGGGETSVVKVVDLVKDLLTRPEIIDDPYIDEVVSVCNLECQVVINSVPMDVPFENMAIRYFRWFAIDSPYENMLQLLKSLLSNYGCVGYIGFDKKFYIVPRKYAHQTSFELSRENMMEEPEANITPRRYGLVANVYAGNGKYQQYGIPNPPSDDRIIRVTGERPENTSEEINFRESGGTLPDGTEGLPTKVVVDSVIYNVEPDSYRNKLPDGSYTNRSALYKIVYEDVNSCIINDRRTYQVEASGNYNTLSFLQYYHFEDSENKFYRMRKASYSLKGKQAKLSLVDATITNLAITPDIVFDAVMEAQNSEVEINGVRHSGTLNQLRIGAENMFAIIDNMFASTSTSIKRYDGTSITIPDDQVSELYKTTEDYLIYLAISKAGSDPEFSYPNPDDSNADWYLLTQFPDQKIFDPDYEYKVLLPKIKPGKMKYWLWMGMKSTQAKIFDKIPLYSPGVIVDKRAKVQ